MSREGWDRIPNVGGRRGEMKKGEIWMRKWENGVERRD